MRSRNTFERIRRSCFASLIIAVVITAKNIIKTKNNLNKILSENTNQPLDKIEKDVDRDYFMSAYEAKDYGLVDQVIEKRVLKEKK